MTKEKLSELIYDSTERIQNTAVELYERLHPNGDVVTNLDEKLLGVFRRFVASLRADVDSMREAIKEYMETNERHS